MSGAHSGNHPKLQHHFDNLGFQLGARHSFGGLTLRYVGELLGDDRTIFRVRDLSHESLSGPAPFVSLGYGTDRRERSRHALGGRRHQPVRHTRFLRRRIGALGERQ